MVKRGLGASKQREPVPFPPPACAPRLVAFGVWFLVRCDEIASLTMGDVAWVPLRGRPTPAVWIRRSKTDPEGTGELVARECICEGARVHYCPSCTLRDQYTVRLGEWRPRAVWATAKPPSSWTGLGRNWSSASF